MLHIQDRTIRNLLREGSFKARNLVRKCYVSEHALKEYFIQPEAKSQKEKQS
jgi:hypothetical protein